MADDGELRAGIGQHRGGNVTGEGAAGFGMAILSADGNILHRLAHGLDQRGRRRERNLHLRESRCRPINGARFGQRGAVPFIFQFPTI